MYLFQRKAWSSVVSTKKNVPMNLDVCGSPHELNLLQTPLHLYYLHCFLVHEISRFFFQETHFPF